MTNTVLATVSETAETPDNVVTVDFGNDPFAPISEFAKMLAEKAAAPVAKKQGGLKDIGSGRKEAFYCNPWSIDVEDGWNARDFTLPENIEHVRKLAETIKTEGFRPQHPLTVILKNGRLVLRDGESRLRATKLAINTMGAEIEGVWVIQAEKGLSELDSLVAQDLANLHKAWNPIEQAALYSKMFRFTDGNVSKIAARLGITGPTFQRWLDLNAAPQTIKKMIGLGTVSVNYALETLKANGDDEQKTLATLTAGLEVAVAAGGTKVTKKHVRKISEQSGNPEKRSKTADLKTIKAILDTATIDNSVAEKVTVTFTAEEFAKIREMFAL